MFFYAPPLPHNIYIFSFLSPPPLPHYFPPRCFAAKILPLNMPRPPVQHSSDAPSINPAECIRYDWRKASISASGAPCASLATINFLTNDINLSATVQHHVSRDVFVIAEYPAGACHVGLADDLLFSIDTRSPSSRQEILFSYTKPLVSSGLVDRLRMG